MRLFWNMSVTEKQQNLCTKTCLFVWLMGFYSSFNRCSHFLVVCPPDYCSWVFNKFTNQSLQQLTISSLDPEAKDKWPIVALSENNYPREILPALKGTELRTPKLTIWCSADWARQTSIYKKHVIHELTIGRM